MGSTTTRRPYVPPDEDLPEGSFRRAAYVFRDWITGDGSSGFPAVAGRYHLYISWACPWAQRTAIVRELLGLGEVVGLSVVDPIRDERGWTFTPGSHDDPVEGFSFLSEAYLATDPDFGGRPTVPTLWDRDRRRIVSNNFHDITIMLATEFEAAVGSPDLYPDELRPDIDALNAVIYADVNDGVYRCGFARTQAAYEYAFDRLFARLDELDSRLADRRYLFGSSITESDVRLFPTLARFDSVYHSHFKCNRSRLSDYTHLWAYTRDLYSLPAFRSTTRLDECKRHYFVTHPHLNPSGIVPKGPLIDWSSPHGRETLSG